MQAKSKTRFNRSTAALTAAIAGISFAGAASAQTTNTATCTQSGEVEIYNGSGETYQDAGGQELQLRGPTNEYPNFCIVDFGTTATRTCSRPGGDPSQFRSLNLNLVLNYSWDGASAQPSVAIPLAFYLATDTNPAEVANGSTLMSWEPSSTYPGGLNAPDSPVPSPRAPNCIRLGQVPTPSSRLTPNPYTPRCRRTTKIHTGNRAATSSRHKQQTNTNN